jgi:hypothetical protein
MADQIFIRQMTQGGDIVNHHNSKAYNVLNIILLVSNI